VSSQPLDVVLPKDAVRVLAHTKALCPTCLRLLPAETIERDGKVFLSRECDRHGRTETLVLSDARWWHWSRRFARPGRAPAAHATPTVNGCPYDCGFCPEHRQHACVTVFEITEACNLACPACFAGDAHAVHRTLDEVRGMAEGLLKAEGGQADVVMLSGGEPTLHPRFLEVADLVAGLPISYVVVNTNGVRIAREADFAHELADRNLLVYLQFDGFAPETYRALRGRADLLDVKLEALERLSTAGVRVVLVATLVKGVNDHEIGDIVRFGAEHPAVRAVSLQPQFGEGRFVPFDPSDRITLTDVIDAIDATSGLFTRDDFVPIPCCDPMCTAATYAWINDGEVIPVTQLVPVGDYLDYVENTAMPNLSDAFRADVDEMRETLLRLYSKGSPAGSDRQTEAFVCACDPVFAEFDRIGDIPGEVFAVTIEGFMDRFNFDATRVTSCCIQEALPDGRIVPFCAFNTLYRFEPDHRPVPRS
jgi:hypothetical protein